ncbi:hypothetical protein [Amycolatopsis sp. NPDC004079]|uniref:hypothetical protein n=1 Tax=Amycolatopsis sp. NPDC004079 TaxID=3154549 RepID=UPI0033A37CCF
MAFMLMTDIDRVAAELARGLRPGGQLSLILSGVQWHTEEIDFSGSLDQVWNFVSTGYNLFPLSDPASSALKTAFFAAAPALTRSDGLIPLAFPAHLASTRTVHKGR